jgi:hypothetical protein
MQLGNIMHATTSEREMHMDSPKFLPNVGESCVLQCICIKGICLNEPNCMCEIQVRLLRDIFGKC